MDETERAGVEAQLVRLAGPAALQGLLFTAVFVVDGVMVSRLGSASMAAVGAAAPILWSVTSVLFAVFVATVALVANRTGAGDVDGARVMAGQSLLLSSVLGAAVAAPLVFGSHAILAPFGLEPSVAALAAGWLAVAGGATVVALPGRVLVWIFQASGDTRTPLVVSALGNVFNLVANYVLIFGMFGAPALGVTGSAVGTAGCRVLELALLAVLVRRSAACPRLGDLIRPRWGALRQILRIGLPSLAEQAVLHGGVQGFALMVTRLGTVALAAHRMCVTVEMVAIMPADGLAVAAAAMTGQLLGAGRPDLAEHGLRCVRRRAFLAMGVLAVVFVAAPGALLAVFAPEPEVLKVGVLALRIGALELVPLGLAVSLAAALRGAGDTRSPLAVTAAGIWLVRVPLTWALVHRLGFGLPGVWLVTSLDWTLRAFLADRAVARGRWKRALASAP